MHSIIYFLLSQFFFFFYVFACQSNHLSSFFLFCKLQWLQEIQENIVAGTHVWIEDPELVFIHGIVLNIRGQEAEIQTSDGNMVNTNHLMPNYSPPKPMGSQIIYFLIFYLCLSLIVFHSDVFVLCYLVVTRCEWLEN